MDPTDTTAAPRRDPGAALRVLMVASEVQPFSKTGGLADVTSALARAVGRLGHEVTLVTPRYRGAPSGDIVGDVRVPAAGTTFETTLHAVPLGDNARALLLDCPALFDRPGIYAENNIDYPDNPLRFAVFVRAAVEWAMAQPGTWSVLHAHDWQAGLLPVYARRMGRPSIFTLHNIAFQGVFDKGWVPALGLSWEDFTIRGFEFWDHVSFLKAGIMLSDVFTTVSQTYAEEIQRPEYGYGFEGVAGARAGGPVGILNGIDYDEWNPARDRYLPAPFDSQSLDGKRAAKRAVLERFQLPTDEAALRRPIVAMVSRMTEQKGLDLIAALAPSLPTLPATFMIMGTGERRFEEMWQRLAAAHPDRFGVYVGFDEARAHLVEAGADLFLMPSRYEPCGLNQMYSMRYGTVPVVRAVGGLVETVRPYDAADGSGTGFLFSDYRPDALAEALTRALAVFRDAPETWRRLQVNGMRRDFSWERSAAEYVQVYKRGMAARE